MPEVIQRVVDFFDTYDPLDPKVTRGDDVESANRKLKKFIDSCDMAPQESVIISRGLL